MAVSSCLPVVWVASGCVSGSLATNTGPRPADRAWSTAAVHPVHIGEVVEFDFVLTDTWGRFVSPVGLADYAVLLIGNERLETELDSSEHFRFSHEISGREADRVDATAEAFRQRDSRDYMKVQGEWLRSDSPYNERDVGVARTGIVLALYQAVIELRLATPPQPFDAESGVMRIERDDGRSSVVYIDRPGRPGFRLTGPGTDGYYTVRYEPIGTQLNPVGRTRVAFTIHDLGGQRHEASVMLDTP
jgi:hypothetical protein